MGRPLKGSKQQTAAGTWQGSVPACKGSTDRVYVTFDDETLVDAWLADAIAVINNGGTPPPAHHYGIAAEPASTATTSVSTIDALNRWLNSYYEELRKGGPDRAAKVEAYFRLHLIPILVHERKCRNIADITYADLSVLVARLAGDQPVGTSTAPDARDEAMIDQRLVSMQKAIAVTGVSKSTINRRRREGRLQEAGWDDGKPLFLVADLRLAGLFGRDTGPTGLTKKVAHDIVWVMRQVWDYARAMQWVTHDPWTHALGGRPPDAAKARSPKKPQIEALSFENAYRLAGQLHVINQLLFWMLRILGLRISESYGPRVGDFIELEGIPLLVIDRQGGRPFLVRDETGAIVRADSKDVLKTETSYRTLVVPDVLAELIATIIRAYHTDPETGVVNLEARLVPGLQEIDSNSQNGFRAALKVAARAAGLPDYANIQPKHLRASLVTELRYSPKYDDLTVRRYAGHSAGDDVNSRHYVLGDPGLVSHKVLATTLHASIVERIGQLMVPTSKRPQFGSGNELVARGWHSDLVLEAAGWQVGVGEAEDPWCGSARLAVELEIARGTAGRWLRDGPPAGSELPVIQRVDDTGKLVRMARLSDIRALRDALDDRVTLLEVAHDLNVSYHDAYRTVQRLGRKPGTHHNGRELLLTDDDVAALRGEYQRITALHLRAMRVVEAAKELGIPRRSASDRVADGRLQLDPETDSSNVMFVTRVSVAEQKRPAAPAVPCASEHPSVSDVSAWTDLSRFQVADLAKAGLITYVIIGREAHVDCDSLIRWAGGHRPELLAGITARCNGVPA